jgi:hypothetical protein
MWKMPRFLLLDIYIFTNLYGILEKIDNLTASGFVLFLAYTPKNRLGVKEAIA